MRAPPAVLLALLAAFSGCIGLFDGKDEADPDAVRPADVGHDPESVTVTGVTKTAHTIPSFDGTELDAVVYSPITGDTLPDGTPPTWGVVVFLHGWGFFKEQFEGVGGATGAPVPADPTGTVTYTINRMQEFANAGVIAVAYDARGFGRSGGQSTVAGPAEMQDLDAVLDFVEATYSTNGLVGLLGQSYGAGQALLALADNPRITTAAPQYGWIDLYGGLVPGNVPKHLWAAELLAGGTAGSKAQMSPMLYEWAQALPTRSGFETVHAQMDQRSVLGRLAATDKPLFLCQGMQETLFPQADRIWESAAGFTRALVFQGGHGADDAECWSRSLDWMLYFVAGHDTGVAAWPALTSVDATGAHGALDYPQFPRPMARTYYLDSPGLDTQASNTTFTIQNRALANPFVEPSAVWDQTGLPYNQVPENFRQDPTAVFFDAPAATGSEVVLGAAVARLQLADPAQPLPYQVVGTLYHVDANGKSLLLARGAHAALGETDATNGTLEIRFDWVKATLGPGDKVVLKLGANDPSMFAPLLAPYDVVFTGQSQLLLPFFEG